jgi:hypothetical protein
MFNPKYAVVADQFCPGAEFEDYEEARSYLLELEKRSGRCGDFPCIIFYDDAGVQACFSAD